MSSHADQSQLISWLKNIKGVKRVFLTHGDIDAREAFSKKIKSELNVGEVTIPEKDQEYSF